jgi:hypothetical protein
MVNGNIVAPPRAAAGAFTLYRVMKSDEQGRPRRGDGAAMLGARPRDLHPDAEDNVGRGRGGVSVGPDPSRLRPQFRPVRFAGGLSQLPLFAIDEPHLAPDLRYEPDGGDRASDHGVIEAAAQMSVATYQAAVAATQPDWRPA